MSQPTLTGLTLLSDCEATTNLSAFGTNANKYTLDTELYLEGANGYFTKFASTGVGGGGATNLSSDDMTDGTLFIGWAWTAAPAFFTGFSSGGLRVRITEGTSWTANFKEWYIGGNDVPFVGQGYRLVACDGSRTADVTNGTAPLTTAEYAGFAHDAAATASQTPSFGMDVLWKGSGVEVTGPSFIDATNGIDINSGGTIDRNDAGSFITDGWEVGDYVKIVGSATSANDGEYEITGVTAGVLTTGETFTQDTANTTAKIYCSVTFQDIVDWDQDETNNTLPYRGVVTKDPGSGAFVINYPLIIGDVSGANSVYFRSVGDAIAFADQPLNTTRVDFIEIVEDTGETYVQFGGTGLAGSTIASAETIYSTKSPAAMELSATDVTESVFAGVTISNLDGGIDLSSASGHSYKGCTFTNCGLITLHECDISGSSILSSAVAADEGAVYDNRTTTASTSITELDNTTFSQGENAHHAIRFGANVDDDITLTGIAFNGFDSTDDANGSTLRFDATTGSINVNLIDCTVDGGPASDSNVGVDDAAGITVTLVVAPKTTKVTCEDSAGSKLQNVRVFLETADNGGGSGFPYQAATSTLTQSAGTATLTASSAHGLATNDYVVVRGATPEGYNKVAQITVTSTTAFTYSVDSGLSTPAGGTPVFSYVPLYGLTDVNGEIQSSKTWGASQAVSGWARKSTSSPYYKEAAISIADASGGTDLLIAMQLDE